MMGRRERGKSGRQRMGRKYWAAGLLLAAAAAVLLWGVMRTRGRLPGEGDEAQLAEEAQQGTDEARLAEEAQQGTDEAQLTEEAQQGADEAGTDKPAGKAGHEDSAAIPTAASYEEIYERLSARAVQYIYKDYGMADGRMATGEAAGGRAQLENAIEDLASDSYSQTNLRQEGVDEGDLVKTDGQSLYVVEEDGGGVQIIRLDSLETEAAIQAGDGGEIQEVYVDGDSLVILENSESTRIASDGDGMYYPETASECRVRVFDISDKGKPRETGNISQEGSFLAARKIGDWMYLFTSCYKDWLGTAEEPQQYIPEAAGALLAWEDIYLPGAEAADRYVLMGAVHVQEPQQVGDRKGVLLPYCDLYVSGQSVWFSTPEYGDNGNQTAIYCFGLEDGDIWAKGAAKVPGELHDSFSLDEYKGCLRLVTTEWDYERGTQMNHLFVLDKELKVIGQIEDIAPGETVRSVRFCQDIGYFVTFRNVDPLFTVDLSAPSSPVIVGELKVTGFSSYLHPYQEGLLLGIGQEADENSGAAEGYKLSMFDISDPAETAEAHKELLGAGYVPGATDYKAVLADGNRNLIGLCRKNQQELYYEVYTYQPDTGFAQVLSYQLAKADSVDGYVNENFVRGLYAGETFYVVSPAEIAAFDMGQEFERTGGRMLP